MVKTLVKYKADVNALDNNHDTPLNLVALEGREKMVSFLTLGVILMLRATGANLFSILHVRRDT